MEKHKYLMLDCETFGTFQKPVVYDLGLAVVDNKGRIYAKYSFIIDDTFYGMQERAKTAYYAWKFPAYHEDIENGRRRVISWAGAMYIANRLVEKWDIKAVIAHNAHFDFTAVNYTTELLKHHKRFFQSSVEWWDTLSMVSDTIAKQKLYVEWCKNHNYMTKNGQPRMTAEIIYKYITHDDTFEESHTGLEDVLIEIRIFAKCVACKKKMKRGFFDFSGRH